MSGLPISLDLLLYGSGVETSRVEFKGTWDDQLASSVVRTVCAFANDLHNLNGGYVILGIDEGDGGRAQLPPRGVDAPDSLQRAITGKCKGLIEPEYLPQIYVEQFDEKTVMVLWVPAGQNPPYQAPRRKDGKAYFVRSGSSTIEATGDILNQLQQKSSRVPFDDRANYQASISQISPALVRQYLEAVRSRLADEIGQGRDEEIYDQLGLLMRNNGHRVPRNIALLFFNHQPEKFFRGAIIEIARYSFEGDVLDERTITGPLTDQIKLAINDIRSRIGTLRKKIDGQAEVTVSHEYPIEAVEEALANALYHRSYESMDVEPTKVHIYPDSILITSYPGPVPALSKAQLEPGAGSTSPPPARNRRIGEMLKDLRLAEKRGTGIAKIRSAMERNGSPPPEFSFDESRTLFSVRLPVHPDYKVKNQLEPVIGMWVSGDRQRALDALREQRRANPGDPIATRQLLEYLFEVEASEEADRVMDRYIATAPPSQTGNEVILLFAAEMRRRVRRADWSVLISKYDFSAQGSVVQLARELLLCEEWPQALSLLLEHQGRLAGTAEYTYLLATAKLLVPAKDGTHSGDVARLARLMRSVDPAARRQAVSFLLEYAVSTPRDEGLREEALRIRPTILDEDDGLFGLWIQQIKPSPPNPLGRLQGM